MNGWYVFAVKATVSATDNAARASADTRCLLDGHAAGARYADLPAACPCLTSGPATSLTEGIHTLYAASIDNAGNTEAIKTIVFKIDKTGPISQVASLPPFQTAAAFPVSWSGTDNLSGVANYDVRYRQARLERDVRLVHDLVLAHDLDQARTFTAPAGSTTCFSVRATDNAGWTARRGAPSNARPCRSTTRRSPASASGRR